MMDDPCQYIVWCQVLIAKNDHPTETSYKCPSYREETVIQNKSLRMLWSQRRSIERKNQRRLIEKKEKKSRQIERKKIYHASKII